VLGLESLLAISKSKGGVKGELEHDLRAVGVSDEMAASVVRRLKRAMQGRRFALSQHRVGFGLSAEELEEFDSLFRSGKLAVCAEGGAGALLGDLQNKICSGQDEGEAVYQRIVNTFADEEQAGSAASHEHATNSTVNSNNLGTHNGQAKFKLRPPNADTTAVHAWPFPSATDPAYECTGAVGQGWDGRPKEWYCQYIARRQIPIEAAPKFSDTEGVGAYWRGGEKQEAESEHFVRYHAEDSAPPHLFVNVDISDECRNWIWLSQEPPLVQQKGPREQRRQRSVEAAGSVGGAQKEQQAWTTFSEEARARQGLSWRRHACPFEQRKFGE
jgi:hypothetical protein